MKLDVMQAASGSPQQSQPWYADGLRFTCQQCGNCCTGGPGYVWISVEEVGRLARLLHLTKSEVVEQYCRKIDGQAQPARAAQSSRRVRLRLPGRARRQAHLHDLRRPPAPMPHVAVLEREPEIARDVGALGAKVSGNESRASVFDRPDRRAARREGLADARAYERVTPIISTSGRATHLYGPRIT
jgi:hypothetical protein